MEKHADGLKGNFNKKIEKVIFWADLELTKIDKSGCRYRVINHKGVGVQDLHHLIIDRKDFPKDDDFSLDFINSDLPYLAKTIEEDNHDGVQMLKKKQARFKEFTKYRLMIVAE